MTTTNPDHYKQEGMEAIDVIEAYFPDQAHLANALKYMLRLGRKDSDTQEVSKVIWYLLRYLKWSGKDLPDMSEYDRLLGDGEKKVSVPVSYISSAEAAYGETTSVTLTVIDPEMKLSYAVFGPDSPWKNQFS